MNARTANSARPACRDKCFAQRWVAECDCDCGPVDKCSRLAGIVQGVAERRPYRHVGMDDGSRLHRVHGACRTDGACAPPIHKGVGVGCGNRGTLWPIGPLLAGSLRRRGILCLKVMGFATEAPPAEFAADEAKDKPCGLGTTSAQRQQASAIAASSRSRGRRTIG